MSLSDTIQYLLDLKHAYSTFQTGFSRPDVYEGYFSNNLFGEFQEEFYGQLLTIGFKRTRWQLVFPGQTAGLIRSVEPPIDGMDEIHVRFYDNGVISAELEHGRFSPGHWRKNRVNGNDELSTILETEVTDMSDSHKDTVQELFSYQADPVISPIQFQYTGPSLSSLCLGGLVSLQYVGCIVAATYGLSSENPYYGIEPLLMVLIETPFVFGGGLLLLNSKQKS